MNDSSRRQIGRIKNQLRAIQADLWSERQEEARYRDRLELDEEDKPESEELKRARMFCQYMTDALEEIDIAIGDVDELMKKLKDVEAADGIFRE